MLCIENLKREKTKDKKLAPTMIGTVVSDYLHEHFPNIVDVKFTAQIESEFDKIAAGKMKWQTVMHNFYDDFVKNVDDKAGTHRVQFAEAVELGKDPSTGLPIVIKTGTFGSYVQLGEKNEETGGFGCGSVTLLHTADVDDVSLQIDILP